MSIYSQLEQIMSKANIEHDREVDRRRVTLSNAWQNYLSNSENAKRFDKRETSKLRCGVFAVKNIKNGGFTCCVDSEGVLFLATKMFDNETDMNAFLRDKSEETIIQNTKLTRTISQESAEKFLGVC